MPLYTVRNIETQESKDIILKWSEREQYLIDNPGWEFIITGAPSIGDPVKLGITRPDEGFKDRLREIHKNTPGSTITDNCRYL